MADIEERIVVERHLTPQDIHDRYKVLNGAIYGLASHGTLHRRLQAGQPQPARARASISPAARPIRAPACRWCMMSGWIAADALDADAEGLRQVS